MVGVFLSFGGKEALLYLLVYYSDSNFGLIIINFSLPSDMLPSFRVNRSRRYSSLIQSPLS